MCFGHDIESRDTGLSPVSLFHTYISCLGSVLEDDRVAEDVFEIVEPIGKRVVIRKDQDKKETKGGIRLPDNIEIPTITGRIVAVSAEVQNDPLVPLKKYDKVLFNPKGAIPVDFEGDNRLFVVELDHVVAVFRKNS